MKHQAKNRKFGRERDQRKALLRSLVNNFLKHGKMTTTEAKAKEIRPLVEKMITRSKTDSVANRRLLAKEITPELVKKMMGEIGPKYASRNGGYTRIIKLEPRKGDGSKMAMIELV